MCRFRHHLGFVATLLAIVISVMPPHTPVTAEGSAGGWVSEQSGTTSSLYGVKGNSPSNVFACGDAGTIVHFDGSAWTAMNSGVTSTLYSLWCASTGVVFAVGAAGTILHYDGTSWSPMASGTSNHLNAIWGLAPDNVIAVGNSGSILHYDGVSWSSMTSGTTSHLRGVWGSSSSDVFAVGNGGIILHYDGISWASAASGIRAKLYGVCGTASNDVVSVGEWGTIVHYDGLSWAGLSSGVANSLNGVWAGSADNVFVVGTMGLILHKGDSWQPMNSGTVNTLYGVWGAASFNVYAVGAGGTILHYHGNPPLITSVSPNQGYQAEVLSAVISGTDFDGVSLVDFGAGVTVTAFSVDGTGTQITANLTIAAAAAPGMRDVSVANPAGSNTLVGAFTVLAVPPPVLTAVAPASGAPGETMVAIVSGTNLSGASLVDFGAGVTVTAFSIDGTGNQITASLTIAAAAAPGARNVSVTNPFGSHTLVGGFTVLTPPPPPPPPIVTGVAPASAVAGETLAVVISGINLNGASLVDLGAGITVTAFSVDPTGTQITANLTIATAAAPGTRDVSVTGPGGSNALPSAFTVLPSPPPPPPPPPTVTAVAPASGVSGETLTVVISGNNLNGASLVDFGAGITVTAFSVDVTGTQITANLTVGAAATPGARDISVTSPAGSNTLPSAFSVLASPPATIATVVPSSGVAGDTLAVVISGTDLDGALLLDFGAGITVTAFSVNAAGTEIAANITIDSNATAGPRDIKVETSRGAVAFREGFKVLIRFSYVTDVSPKSGLIGNTLDIVISGVNLDSVTAVAFGAGIEVNSFRVDGAGQISVRIIITPEARAGYRDVSIVTPWNNYSHLEGFAVVAPPPGNLSVGQTYGRVGQEMTVTVEGINLVGVTRVSFGPGIEVIGFDMYPPTSLRVRIKIAPDAEPGVRDVTVTTAPGGTCTIESAFEIGGTETSTPPLIPIGAAGGSILAGAGAFLLVRRLRRS